MSKTEWFRSWFDSPYYPILYRNRDFKEARQFIDALLSFLNPASEALFLDVACGRGRHSIYLNSLGFDVTGIDISANSIKDANASASANLKFHVHDMRDPLNLQAFDISLNLFTSFGYFDTRAEHLQSLQNIADATKPGGRFVLDYLNIDLVKKHIIHRQEATYENISFNITKEIRDDHIMKDIEVQDGDHYYHFEERVMAFSGEELENMLKKVGLEIEHRFGNYALESVSEERPRMILVARKKA